MTRTFKDDLERNLRDPEFAKRFGAARAKSNFAITLAEARRQLNLTQQQLAVKVGVSQAYIAKLEGGEANPTLDTIGSLLAVLGLSLTTGTTNLYYRPETHYAFYTSSFSKARGVPFITDATKGGGSSHTESELVSIK